MNDSFPRCQHLTLNGARCTTPALRDKEFCYEHHYRRVRRARRLRPWLPDTRDLAGPLVTFVYMDDLVSVLENINATAQAFAEHSIDHRQVGSLTYLMNTALKTVEKMSKLEKVRKEDIPTQVIHDDLDEPMALPDAKPLADAQPLAAVQPLPDASNSFHPERSEGPCVSDHGSQFTDHTAAQPPVSSLLSPDSETASAGEGPCVSDHGLRIADHAVVIPDPASPYAEPCALHAVTAAADPTPEHPTPHRENPRNSSRSNHIEKSLFSTNFFSITSTLRPCLTTPDSTLAQIRGVGVPVPSPGPR